MKLVIKTPINPTENEQRVIKAMSDAFPGCAFESRDGELICRTENMAVLSVLKQKIEEKRIKNTVQYLVLNNQKLELNKQTLMLGKFHFVEEPYPLGNVTIEPEPAQELLRHLIT
jgi:predicted RNA binding protein with dsRBD fold (UPF0201 family)